MTQPRNEEQAKLDRLKPYLDSLGLNRADLVFEKSFTLTIGTNRVTVNRKRRQGEVGGRLDTLVTHNGLPLFVVELKEESHDLNDDDSDQAVSYARLVHPIAPYALVTNTKVYRLYETISKAEIQPGQFKLQSGYDLILPDETRNQALDFFLGYSTDNLVRFCEAQVAEQMKPLIGSPEDISKKFIPELAVENEAVGKELAAFESGDQAAFLLVGESGVGKTNALCLYARARLAAGKPTLFYTGGALRALERVMYE